MTSSSSPNTLSADSPTNSPCWLDAALLDEVTRQAKAHPRRRKNLNLHPHDAFPAHRLLNAIEPDSYIQPHCHLDPSKDETLLLLRGSLGVVYFDELGHVVLTRRLSQRAGDALGVDVLHGIWHSFVALEPGTVVFECKAGPYVPLSPAERATWAPAEGAPEATAYLQELQARFMP